MTTIRQIESELMTPGEVAIELRCSSGTVKRWLRSGSLPGIRLPGGEWRVVRDDLRALRTDRIREHHRRDAPASTREPA